MEFLKMIVIAIVLLIIGVGGWRIAEEHTEYSYFKSMITHLAINQKHVELMLTAKEIEEFINNYQFRNRRIQNKDTEINIISGSGLWNRIKVIEIVVRSDSSDKEDSQGVFVTTGYREYCKYRHLIKEYEKEEVIRKRVNSIPSVYDWIRNSNF